MACSSCQTVSMSPSETVPVGSAGSSASAVGGYGTPSGASAMDNYMSSARRRDEADDHHSDD